MARRRGLSVLVAALAALTLPVVGAGVSPALADPPSNAPVPFQPTLVHHDVGPSVANAPQSDNSGRPHREVPLLIPGQNRPGSGGGSGGSTDGALQPPNTFSTLGTTAGLSFDGVGVGMGSYADCCAPPDTNGAVGPSEYVQWVNLDYAVFNKTTGALVAGPTPGNSIWKGFGGGCETNNDGDPIVKFDQLAQRWVMTQFSVSTTPYLQCIAVSSGPTFASTTTTWNRYAYSFGSYFPDYPKLGVWPDAYYMSFNLFANGRRFSGAGACAFDSAGLLAGAPNPAQCWRLSSYASLLPADLDGGAGVTGSTAQPPPGEPGFFLDFGSNSLNLFKLKVNWAGSNSSSTLTGPTNLSVPTFTEACGGGTCVPQAGTSQQLDSLADRLMYRLAYRNFPNATTPHESLVVTHSVTGSGTSAPRWYEIQISNTSPTIYQASSYAPDSTYRWMGSVAMDKLGDMALGYSASSGSINPGIRYTGRAAGDPKNTMETEATILAGTGSQIGGLSRWGDYSSMAIDPVDDCTFWYANEYLKKNGSFNWSTHIASFKFPNCT